MLAPLFEMRQDIECPSTRAPLREDIASSGEQEIRRSTNNAKSNPAPPRAGSQPGDRTGRNDRINKACRCRPAWFRLVDAQLV
jgi:hypothetical protein